MRQSVDEGTFMGLFLSVLTTAVLNCRNNPEAEKRGGLFLKDF
jgi:hypothetical protein